MYYSYILPRGEGRLFYTSSGTWTHMAGGHSFLRTARLPITAYLHEKGGLNYLMLSENTMSIVVRMTSYTSILYI